MIRRLALLALMYPVASYAQVIDQGTLSIRRGNVEIGREEFLLSSGRGADGRTAGTTITATAAYPSIDPTVEFRGVVERNTAGALTVFQLEYDGPGGAAERFLGGQDRRRITVHRFEGNSRAAREYPGGPAAAVLVDSLFSLHLALADLATPEGTKLTLVSPRQNRRLTVTATVVPAGTGSRVEITGDLSLVVIRDASGRLQRIEQPGTGLVAQRVED